MKIEIEVSKKYVVEKMIDFLTDNSDECYTNDTLYPPSEEYAEFLEQLKKSI